MLLTNYLVIGWRNIIKNKLFSCINIFGLAIGLAACSLITLFVRAELGYDSFWQQADKIQRVHLTFNIPGRDPIHAVSTPGPVMQGMKKYFPQIDLAARIAPINPTIEKDGQNFVEEMRMVDADFINIFDFETVKGDLSQALNDPHSLVLTQTLAKKYFADQDPLGQTLSLDFDAFKRDYKITAVIKDLPENSQLTLSAMVLIDESDWTHNQSRFISWFSVNSQLYITTKKAGDLAQINAGLDDFVNNNFPKLPIGGDDVKASELLNMSAMNIQQLHLNAIGMGEFNPRGSNETVMVFSAIALLILFIASINFMNLSTARASQRAKEVSIRKVMGASRANLISQFLGESILLTLLALAVAISLVEFVLPLYNDILNKSLAIDYGSTDLLQITALALVVGLIGGAYPAFVLSNFRPATVLKSNKSAETSASLKLRAVLVVIQFSVSIGLFISTGVVYSQMLYAESMDSGFNKDNMLIINRFGREAANQKREMMVEELSRNPQVTAITWSQETPGGSNENNTSMRTPDMSPQDALLIGQRTIGYDFFKTYQMELVAGRSYSRDRNDIRTTTAQLREGTDFKSSIILNESALRRLGLGTPEQAIGKSVFTGRGDPTEKLEAELEIIGVVSDVHFDSLKASIRPEIYHLSHNWGRSVSIRFIGDPMALVKTTQSLWQQEIPGIPFSYSFVVDDIAQQYDTEQGEAKMFAAFSALAILVACLGLYGLASFTAERRTKEIGLRKVMGASVLDIVKLLVWQFSKPVLVANIIAWPAAFWLMSTWLESFVYRIDSSVIIGLSVMAGMMAMLIAWATVAGNSVRVAKSNPIKALRYE